MKRRRTRQLTATFEILAAARDHPTADELFERVRERVPRVSLGTVYRNLEKLREEGRVRVIRLPGEGSRYDAVTHRHDHFVCERCGAVRDMTARLPPLDFSDIERRGAVLHRAELVVYGTCERCSRCRTAVDWTGSTAP